MSIFKKLMTAARGGATEAGEALVDKNALRILDQEIRDADADLRKANDSLTVVMAKQKGEQRKADELAAQITKYETAAGKALEAGNEQLAMETAERVATLEVEHQAAKGLADEFAASVDSLRVTIRQTNQRLTSLKNNVSTVKATESVQRAQSAIAARHSGTNASLGNAVDSLERIKRRQAEQKDRFEAAAELESQNSETDLDAKLKAAGIGEQSTSAADVLARIKAKKS